MTVQGESLSSTRGYTICGLLAIICLKAQGAVHAMSSSKPDLILTPKLHQYRYVTMTWSRRQAFGTDDKGSASRKWYSVTLKYEVHCELEQALASSPKTIHQPSFSIR